MNSEPEYMKPGEDGQLPDNWPLLLFNDLLPYATRWTKNHADAEDLAQETVIRAGQNLDRLRNALNIRAWLLTVMQNLRRDEWRKNRRTISSVPLLGNESVEELPSLLRVPDPDHWLMGILRRSTGKRKDFVRLATEEDFDEYRIALKLKERKEYAERPLEAIEHYVRRKFQDLREWIWESIGFFPEVKAHLAYERDQAFQDSPVTGWRELLLGRAEWYTAFEDSKELQASWPSFETAFWLHVRGFNTGSGPHHEARQREFSALEEYNFAIRSPTNGLIYHLGVALGEAERSAKHFDREGMKVHHARVVDHYERMEQLLAKARSEEQPANEDGGEIPPL
jgi:DNA-directed RNA polymerase specialized sigma24 family protein